jgi:putative MATE family efflux protein
MRDLTQGNEAKTILLFAAPMLIGNVFQQLYNVVDSIVVGQFIGKAALAAVGASFSINFLLIAMISGIAMGSGIMIAQYVGAKDTGKVRRIIATTYIYLLVASLAVTGIGLAAARPILRLLDTPADVLEQATVYLHIIFTGMLFQFGYNAVSAVLRGLGDSKTPLYFLIVATLTNVVLDLLFVAVFRWGVGGAAWATIISQAIAFVPALFYLQRSRHEVLRLDPKRLAFDVGIFRQCLRIGLPSGAQQTLVAMGFMALNRIVNGFGTDVAAGYTAASRLDSFAGMPAMNFSMALTTFVGQNLGAGRHDRVRSGFLATLAISGGFAVLVSLTMVFFKVPLMRIFTTDARVIAVGSDYLVIVGSFYILFSSMFITGSVPRGAGDTLIPMFITIFSLWLIRIPLAALLSSRIGTDGIWWAVPIAWGGGCAANVMYYLSGRWKSHVLVKRPPVVEEG